MIRQKSNIEWIVWFVVILTGVAIFFSYMKGLKAGKPNPAATFDYKTKYEGHVRKTIREMVKEEALRIKVEK